MTTAASEPVMGPDGASDGTHRLGLQALIATHDLELYGRAHLDRRGSVGNDRAMEGIDRLVGAGDLAEPAPLVERADAPLHCTILAMGISRIPVAPLSFRAGMSVLMSCLATTVSTA